MLPAYTAQLRVYEPLAAFSGQERREWESYVAAADAPDPATGLALEHRAALTALVAAPPQVATPQTARQAYVRVVDGVTLVCPWRTRLRACLALTEFRSGLPDEIADAFVPRALADAAVAELEAYRLDSPGLVAHVQSSTWHVPLRWFLLVAPEERTLLVGGRDRSLRALSYLTPMSRARRRAARALAVLRRTVEEGPVVRGVEDLARWIEEFHPRSYVELDYGGLVHLLDDESLRADESARDVADALSALAEGDALAASRAYERVSERMRALQALESAN